MAEIDQNVSSSSSVPTQPQKSSQNWDLWNILLAFGTLFLIGFILFALNYLNILRLDGFIAPLGLLPKYQGTVTPVIAPTSGALQPAQNFQYDEKKASDTLSPYIHTVLQDKYITSDPIKKLDPSHTVGQNLPNYGKYWKKGNDFFIADFIFLTGTNLPMDLHILILKDNGIFNTGAPKTLNETQAQQLIKTYFKLDPSGIRCTTNSNHQTTCERFAREGDMKTGFGAALDASKPDKIRYGIFACQIYNLSPNFDKATSCVGDNSL